MSHVYSCPPRAGLTPGASWASIVFSHITTYRRFLCIYVNNHKDWAVGLENSNNSLRFLSDSFPSCSPVTRSTTTTPLPRPARLPARGEAAMSVPVVEGVVGPPSHDTKCINSCTTLVELWEWPFFRCGCINKRVIIIIIIIWPIARRPSPGHVSWWCGDGEGTGHVTEARSSRISVKFDVKTNEDGWWQAVTYRTSLPLVLHATCCLPRTKEQARYSQWWAQHSFMGVL